MSNSREPPFSTTVPGGLALGHSKPSVSSADGSYPIPPGFEWLGLLGEGGMGYVIHARDPRLDREVAIKVFKRSEDLGPEFRDAFLTEARAIARVRHPSLVEIYHCGEFDQQPYFVMQYLKGQSLARWLELRKGAQVPLDQVSSIVGQVARGLAALHAEGTVHRDIKPLNLMIDEHLQVKIVDFGLAGFRGERGHHDGRIIGTPDYIAPELVSDGLRPSDENAAADVYALGIVTYEMLTGELPFRYASIDEVLQAHVEQTPSAPSAIRRDLPPAFDALVFRAMSKFPRARPTAAAFAERLAKARGVANREDLGQGLQVLLVDDDPDIGAWIGSVIENAFAGAKVCHVLDGDAALDAIDDVMPDLVIADIEMPRLTGIQLASVLRERPATQHIPVLIISATGTGEQWATLKKIGAAKMLLKPLDEEDFLDDVRRIMRKHRAQLDPGSPA